MTKEEAIKVLNQVRQYTDYPKEAFTMAIDALSQPSLPSNLDKAAEEYGKPYHDRMAVTKAFKSGAEWMAGQGETRDDIIVKGDFDDKAHIFPIPSSKFNPGDKVVVQIRKKQ